MQRGSIAMLLAAALSWVALPAGATELLLAPGFTSEGQATASAGLGLAWDRRWFESGAGHLGGYWSIAYTWWDGGELAGDEQSISVAPVFVYHFNSDGWQPFVEIGIGAAWFSNHLVGDRNMGSRLHFEDRFGFGIRFSERDALRLRGIHYSNGGLEEPNDGIESWSLVYSRRF
jgi:lipid A 3-O-deacylase